MLQKICILAGPTAVGKTEISLALAKSLCGEIISADSAQVYKYMDIGTAKLKEEEMQGIRHYMIDEVTPDMDFSVAQLREKAELYIKDINDRGKLPIITGGTGLYINSLLNNLDFTAVRGTQGIKEATYNAAGLDIKVAVASGLGNARKLLDDVKSGKSEYHFIEIMGCPGGCVNGGGQPRQPASVRNFTDIKALRAHALYKQDAAMSVRKSHENEAIKQLYDEFLGAPNSHKAHEILHTTYVKRTVNQVL